MSGSLESTYEFEKKLKFYGLAELKEKFTAKGWCTLNSFAMAGSYIPGTSQQESLVNDIYKPLLGEEALTDNRQIGIKRLFWDAFVGHATELKRRTNVSRMATKGSSGCRTARKLLG